MRSEVAGIDTSGMEFFYNPRSIAIVGASRNPDKPGGRPLAALRNRGYAGKVFPINPRYRELAEPFWPDCSPAPGCCCPLPRPSRGPSPAS